MQGELLLAMTYGYEPQGRDDKMVETPRQLSDFGAKMILPSALLVNTLPFRLCHPTFRCWALLITAFTVRHIPEWVPWFSYKPLARLGYDIGQNTMHEPLRFVRESMASDCFLCLHVSEELIFYS
jgi:hypothetical protein